MQCAAAARYTGASIEATSQALRVLGALAHKVDVSAGVPRVVRAFVRLGFVPCDACTQLARHMRIGLAFTKVKGSGGHAIHRRGDTAVARDGGEGRHRLDEAHGTSRHVRTVGAGHWVAVLGRTARERLHEHGIAWLLRLGRDGVNIPFGRSRWSAPSLGWCSGIYFERKALCRAQHKCNHDGGTSWTGEH